MKCLFCNQSHPDNALFCPVSGKSLQNLVIPEVSKSSSDIVCPHCSKPIPPQGLFCPHCGYRFRTEGQPIQISQKSKKIQKKKPRIFLLIIAALFGVALLIIGYLYLSGYFPEDMFTVVQKRQPTIQVLNTVAIQSTATETPKFTNNSNSNGENKENIQPLTIEPTITPTGELTQSEFEPEFTKTPTLTPLPTASNTPSILAVDVKINEKDQAEIVLIPAGEFLMGSDSDTDPYFWGSEGPSHNVYLDGYLIYRNEVTNEMYQACVSAGACPRPQSIRSRTRDDYYGNSEYANYPVIYVTYTSALSYCRWIGGRLPTEAEWERAARGDIDSRLFPWGSTPANGNQANFCDRGCVGPEVDSDKEDGYRDTAPIGSYPDGISQFGLYDMGGNVWEWVFDYFNAGYYQISPEKNPRGPQSSLHRVIRGGSWNNPSSGVRIVQRTGVKPEDSLDTLGFRCALDAKE